MLNLKVVSVIAWGKSIRNWTNVTTYILTLDLHAWHICNFSGQGTSEHKCVHSGVGEGSNEKVKKGRIFDCELINVLKAYYNWELQTDFILFSCPKLQNICCLCHIFKGIIPGGIVICAASKLSKSLVAWFQAPNFTRITPHYPNVLRIFSYYFCEFDGTIWISLADEYMYIFSSSRFSVVMYRSCWFWTRQVRCSFIIITRRVRNIQPW